MCVCVCLCVCVCACVCMCVCMSVCLSVCMYACMYDFSPPLKHRPGGLGKNEQLKIKMKVRSHWGVHAIRNPERGHYFDKLPEH